MSFIAELQRMQQNIKELNQTFEALTESVDRYQNTRTDPKYPNELRESDEVSKRFYREPKS